MAEYFDLNGFGSPDDSGNDPGRPTNSIVYTGGNGNQKSLRLSNRSTPLQYLPDRVRRELAWHLDVASWEHGWDGVAADLHFRTPHIQHIKSRCNCSVTPTERLLSECDSSFISVENVIRAIHSRDNQPALTIICEAYPDVIADHDSQREALAKVMHNHTSQMSQTQTSPQCLQDVEIIRSGQEVTHMMASSNDAEVKTEICVRHLETGQSSGCFVNKTADSTGGSLESLRSSTGTDDEPRTGAAAALAQAGRVPPTMCRQVSSSSSQGAERNVRVYLTYSDSNPIRMRTVYKMAKCLVQNNFHVSHEESSQHQMAHDKLGWLDMTFRNSHFILVLITPEYAQDVLNVATENLIIDPTDRALNSRYIYRLMQSEYVTSRCINRRFIPVLMPAVRDLPEAGRDLVPTWLQNTLIYSWPLHYKDLFFHMISADRIMRNFIATRRRADAANENIYVSRS